MDVDFLPVYVVVMKILGGVILVIGCITLYLIFCYSGKGGKRYQLASFAHQFLLLCSHSFLCLCYIPIVVPPYIAIYPAGYLKDMCSSISLLIFQLSVFFVGVASVSPLFYQRLLAVLPADHFLHRFYVSCSVHAYIVLLPVSVSTTTLPFAYMEQAKTKAYLYETERVYDPRLLDPETVALSMTSAGMIGWTFLMALALFSFISFTTIVATWTLSVLRSMTSSMSQKTRSIQRKLTVSLIVQTVTYNVCFVGISFSILMFVVAGYGYTVLISVLFWMYSSAFIFNSVLLVLTNDRYKHAAVDTYCFLTRKFQRADSIQVIM